MNRIVVGLVVIACASCGLFMDERWEGRADDCSNGVADFDVLLLLEAPTLPTPTGYVGFAGTNASDTWTLAPIEEGQSTPNGLSFEAVMDLGGDTMRIEVELEASGSGYTGEWEHTVNQTVRCDLELEKQ